MESIFYYGALKYDFGTDAWLLARVELVQAKSEMSINCSGPVHKRTILLWGKGNGEKG